MSTLSSAQVAVVFESLESRQHLSAANVYLQTNLVSDGATAGTTVDANLVNPWGLAAGPTGPFWVADNGTAKSTAYSGSTIVPPTVTIPKGAAADGAAPTGVAYNNTSGFVIGTTTQHKARYLFAGEDGTITAWEPTVDLNNALLEVDNSASGAIYKGIAIAKANGKPMAYAANFHSGAIDVFDKNFAPATLSGNFSDPTLPTGFAPFNIEFLKGKLYVAYAEQGAGPDEVDGAGLGFVDAFNTSGKFLGRIASGGTLNAPWGMAIAPAGFGKFSGDLLVGNFGDGTINAFKRNKANTVDGQLQDANGGVISISGLWGISFGNGSIAGKRNQLYFAAGTNDEADGLFGVLAAQKVTNPGGGNLYP